MATSKYNKRRWAIPSKRAKGYAEERKAVAQAAAKGAADPKHNLAALDKYLKRL